MGLDLCCPTFSGALNRDAGIASTTQWTAAMPSATIPITLQIPVPLFPPTIVTLGQVTVPSTVIVALTSGILLDSLGIGPAFDGLDLTAKSLRATRFGPLDRATGGSQGRHQEQGSCAREDSGVQALSTSPPSGWRQNA